MPQVGHLEAQMSHNTPGVILLNPAVATLTVAYDSAVIRTYKGSAQLFSPLATLIPLSYLHPSGPQDVCVVGIQVMVMLMLVVMI